MESLFEGKLSSMLKVIEVLLRAERLEALRWLKLVSSYRVRELVDDDDD